MKILMKCKRGHPKCDHGPEAIIHELRYRMAARRLWREARRDFPENETIQDQANHNIPFHSRFAKAAIIGWKNADAVMGTE